MSVAAELAIGRRTAINSPDAGLTTFTYDPAGVRKIRAAASPTIYPNQCFTDFGGGTAGSQFKRIFIGSERIAQHRTGAFVIIAVAGQRSGLLAAARL